MNTEIQTVELKRMFNLSFPKLLKNDIAIDLGTANTLIYIKDEGIVVNEPSVVAVRKATQEILAFGNQAKEMLGRTPGEIVTVRPLKDGVIADFELAEQMIRHFIRKARRGWALRPRIAISIPSGITEVEKRAVRDSAEHVGAREVHLVSEPMAAAIGVGLPIEQPVGSMVIDIGGGTTEIAVISLSGIVKAISLRVAGDEETESIIRYCRKKFNILIGENTAEQIKCAIGSAAPYRWSGPKQVEGLDVQTGKTKSIELSAEKVLMQLPAVEHEPEFNLVISRIQQYVQQKFGAQIDSRLTSHLANSLGYGLEPDKIQTMSIRGRDLVTGIPRTITISSTEVQEALSEAVNAIVKAVLKCLEETPPELAADILERGIILSGGGGLLKNLDQRLRKETDLPVYLVDDALLCVVKGVGRVLENLTEFQKVLLQNKRHYY
jgi:rod shape-determining protein MreB